MSFYKCGGGNSYYTLPLTSIDANKFIYKDTSIQNAGNQYCIYNGILSPNKTYEFQNVVGDSNVATILRPMESDAVYDAKVHTTGSTKLKITTGSNAKGYRVQITSLPELGIPVFRVL